MNDTSIEQVKYLEVRKDELQKQKQKLEKGVQNIETCISLTPLLSGLISFSTYCLLSDLNIVSVIFNTVLDIIKWFVIASSFAFCFEVFLFPIINSILSRLRLSKYYIKTIHDNIFDWILFTSVILCTVVNFCSPLFTSNKLEKKDDLAIAVTIVLFILHVLIACSLYKISRKYITRKESRIQDLSNQSNEILITIKNIKEGLVQTSAHSKKEPVVATINTIQSIDTVNINNATYKSSIKKLVNNPILTKSKNLTLRIVEDIRDLYSTTERIKKQQKQTTKLVSNTNYLERAKVNQAKGYSGELFVIEHERNYLLANNKPELANKVMHVAKSVGDGLGYDILSFDLLGNEKYIEVKTSSGKFSTDFYLTANELETIRSMNNYFIYRVFDFDVETGKGSLYKINCKQEFGIYFSLIPTQYRVSAKYLN